MGTWCKMPRSKMDQPSLGNPCGVGVYFKYKPKGCNESTGNALRRMTESRISRPAFRDSHLRTRSSRLLGFAQICRAQRFEPTNEPRGHFRENLALQDAFYCVLPQSPDPT